VRDRFEYRDTVPNNFFISRPLTSLAEVHRGKAGVSHTEFTEHTEKGKRLLSLARNGGEDHSGQTPSGSAGSGNHKVNLPRSGRQYRSRYPRLIRAQRDAMRRILSENSERARTPEFCSPIVLLCELCNLCVRPPCLASGAAASNESRQGGTSDREILFVLK
jgi:hypothetical protein